MKLFHSITLAAVLSLLFVPTFEANTRSRPPTRSCSKTCHRKEIRDLTDAERNAYFKALGTLMNSGEYARIVQIHGDYQAYTHGGAAFLPWHRAYLADFEKALQRVDPNVCLHYWSWDYDSQAPENSVIFQSSWYSRHNPSTGCVTFQWAPGYRVRQPSPGCLRRGYTRRIPAFYSTELLNRLVVRSSTYDEFRTNLEGAPHAGPHNGIGGHMSTMLSPNDPIFFMHHTFIDKLWAKWQATHKDVANTYNGQRPDGTTASASDVLNPYPYKASDMYNIADYCYDYVDLSSAGASRSTVSRVQSAPTSTDDVPDTPVDNGSAPASNGTTSSNDTAPAPTPAPTEAPAPPADVDGNDAPKFDIKPAGDEAPVTADDRSDLTKLRPPNPVPDEWIEMNHLDANRTRMYESHSKTVYDSLNNLDGYVSNCALYHRDDLWHHSTASVKDFQLRIPHLGVIHIKVKKSNSKVIEKCKHYLDKYSHIFYKHPKELEGELTGLCGASIADDPTSPSSPMAPAPQASVQSASSTGSSAEKVMATMTMVVLMGVSLIVL